MARRVAGVGLWVVAWVAGMGCREGAITGPVAASFQTAPSSLEFGPTAIGSEKTLELKVVNDGRAPFRVLEASPSVPNVRIEEFEPFTLGGGEVRNLKVTFTPAVEGSVQGVVELKTDADRKGGSAQAPLAGLGVKALVEVKTSRLDFGNVALGTVQMREIKLKNPTAVAATVPFELQGPDADQFIAAAIGAELTLQPGQELSLPIGFKPGRLGVAQAFARIGICNICEPTQLEIAGNGVASMLDISPISLSFGRVAIGSAAEQTVVVTNLGNVPFDFRGVQILNDSTGSFRINSAPAPIGGQLRPGATLEIGVTFTPVALGPVRGALLQVDVAAPGSTVPGPKLAMSGEGGNSCVAVFPRALDFGLVPQGMSTRRRVDVFNRCPQDVSLSSIGVSTQSGGFFALDQPSTSVGIPAGASTSIAVAFTPRAGSTSSNGSLSFRVLQGAGVGTERVALTGTSRAFNPCSYSVVPSALNFGDVPVGAEVTLAVSIVNTGTEQCFVSGLKLVSGTDPAFTATEVPGKLLDPGKKVSLSVKFKPSAEQLFSGMAEAWVTTGEHPTLAITGRGARSCFSFQPTTVDFGTSKLTCGPRTREVIGFNNCSTSVTVQSAQLGTGASPEFSITRRPSAFPYTVRPGDQVAFTVQYAPSDEGDDSAAFRVATAEYNALTVGLVGQGQAQPMKTDRFMQDNRPKVDVLFVIDNSGSMSEEQDSLARNFASFLTTAQEQNTDYHIGVTTTGIQASPGGWTMCPGGVDGGEAGRLFPANNSAPRIITPLTSNASAVFANNVRVGICHWDEQGLEAAYRALSAPLINSIDDSSTPLPNDGNDGFIRDDAKLAVVFVSDEEDQSVQPLSFYETFFKALKGGEAAQISLSAIVGPLELSTCPTASSAGSRYISLANATGGAVESICTADWAHSLENLSKNAFGSRKSFQLSETPADPAQLTVQINGMPITTGWTYDATTQSLVFADNAVPPPGAIIDVTYPLGC